MNTLKLASHLEAIEAELGNNLAELSSIAWRLSALAGEVAAVRREAAGEQSGATGGGPNVSVLRDRRAVAINGRQIRLTKMEFDAMELLWRHAGWVVSFTRIQEIVWGYDAESGHEAIHHLMFRLRKKLQAGNVAQRIEAVRGVGYRLKHE